MLLRTLLAKWTISDAVPVRSTAERVRIQGMLERTAEALRQIVARSNCVVAYARPGASTVEDGDDCADDAARIIDLTRSQPVSQNVEMSNE